jgi:hypothetical protein
VITIREERNRTAVPANATLEANAIINAERCLTQIADAFNAAGWRVDEMKVTFPGLSTDIATVINWRRDR